MTSYIVRWYVPALCEWVQVAVRSTLEAATQSEQFFRKQMTNCWIGELKIGIVEVIEREV